jgi:hypothetical protein
VKYNELAYAENIYKNGFLTKHFPTELRLLILYFRDVLGLKPKEREYKVYEFCRKYIPNFKKEKFYKSINKALQAGLNKEQKLITIPKIDIYQVELDYINSLDLNQDYKKVLFTFFVQKKLDKTVYELKHGKDNEYNILYFKGGSKKYNNIKKISNIQNKTLLNDEVINNLGGLGLVKILHKGAIILEYINNCKEEGNIVFSITDYDNIGLYLDYYNNIKGVIKCEQCGKIIKMKNNRQKYCEECYKEINQSDAKYRMQRYRDK